MEAFDFRERLFEFESITHTRTRTQARPGGGGSGIPIYLISFPWDTDIP